MTIGEPKISELRLEQNCNFANYASETASTENRKTARAQLGPTKTGPIGEALGVIA